MNNIVNKPRVIVCPLDWGLGHATRCIPVIRELISHGTEVIIAGDGSGMSLLHDEFPDIQYEKLRGYGIKFSEKRSVGNYLLLNSPRYLFRAIKEHNELMELVSRTNADAIISDNRYGLWHKGIFTVFITHQPNIVPPGRLKFARPVLRKITRYFIKKYDVCWIPDFADSPGLSGDLSHGWPLPENVSYIGPLSRFYSTKDYHNESTNETTESYQIVGIISGPEPHRTRFEQLLINQLRESNIKSLIVRGTPDVLTKPLVEGNLTIVNHLKAIEMYSVLKNSQIVVCRGGYSTLMDLSVTGNKVICVPTPGQSEQEYLAGFLSSQGYAVSSSENNFSLMECYSKVLNTERLPACSGLLTQAVQSMLEAITLKK